MALRANWKGFLKLSLVSCPVALYPAVAAEERLSFRRVNRRTGHRLRQQLIDAVTGEPVESRESGRGYEVGDNQFLIVEDEEVEAAEQEARDRPFAPGRASRTTFIEAPHPAADFKAGPHMSEEGRRVAGQRAAPPPRSPAAAPPTETPPLPAPVRIENNRTIEIDRSIPRAQLDPVYFQTPYYIAPRDEVGQEAFAVIRDAMRGKEVFGMGRVVLARRERPLILMPHGLGLRGITLRFGHEIRDPLSTLQVFQKCVCRTRCSA